jgi:predicted ABC-type ATPase
VRQSKQLWLLAGGNGAGKSTFYRLFLQPTGIPFINADILARILYPDAPEDHSYEAARVAEGLREQLLLAGRSFCFETVFSHPSKVDFVARAKALGYEVVLVAIHVEGVDLNQARIAQRVSAGGHAVPPEKVASRIPRTLQHLKAAIPLCDEVRMLDNSSSDDPFRQVLTIKDGAVRQRLPALPRWAEELVRQLDNE